MFSKSRFDYKRSDLQLKFNMCCLIESHVALAHGLVREKLQMNRMPDHCRSISQSAREREIAHLTAVTLLA